MYSDYLKVNPSDDRTLGPEALEFCEPGPAIRGRLKVDELRTGCWPAERALMSFPGKFECLEIIEANRLTVARLVDALGAGHLPDDLADLLPRGVHGRHRAEIVYF